MRPLAFALALLAGCGGTVETSADGGEGGTTSTGITTATIDTCTGCHLDGVCLEPAAEHCGVDGAACVDCSPGSCVSGACDPH